VAEPASARISGPERLTLRQASRRGPFSGRGARLELLPVLFSVVNAGTTRCAISLLGLDPLQRAETGTLIDASLRLRQLGPRDDMVIPPGDHIMLELGGFAPARPGAYTTSAMILTGDCGNLRIPVSIEIPASPLWGIGSMLLGLICLGLINFFAGEGAVKTQLYQALGARQAMHTWLEANPAPQNRLGDVEAMDRDFDAAVTALGERRQLSLVDHRATEAAEHLKAADTTARELRRELAGRPRGAVEIADLTQDFTELQHILKQVATFTGPLANPPSTGLAGKLDAFLLRYRTRFLQLPAGWMSDEMAAELNRIRLAYAAGEGETARDLALTARSWSRRSARRLNTALTGYRGALVLSGSMVATDAALRARVARPDFPAADRASILALLDAASAKMDGEAWLPEWAEAHRLIESANTALTRSSAETLKARFADAIAAVNNATDTDDVNRLFAELEAAPDHSLAAKKAGLTRVLDLWRAHVAGVTDGAVQVKLKGLVDADAALIAKGDFQSAGPIYRTLAEDWASWNNRLVKKARDQLYHQLCLDRYADLQRDTGAIEASLRERMPGPKLDNWDRRLDQLRFDMLREGPDAETVTKDCLAPLLDLSARANGLSGEILKANITDLEVPSLTRIRLARASGLRPAIAATEANQDRARPLRLRLVTPAEEAVVGRRLTFVVEHMDPVWVVGGVQIGVDFGDGSRPFVATAEQLSQDRPITHEYAAPLTTHLSVVAAEELKPGGIEPVDAALGEGERTVLVAPSPVSRAERLADDFLNLRFAIALLIALVVYYWRYHSRTAILGARSVDYVEAFAVGFAANAAVANLPEVLAKAFTR
jgi:hypothetical protein